MKIVIGCDHAGYALKGTVVRHLEEKGYEVCDKGTYSNDSCNYPDIAAAVSKSVASGECELGILVCGTGIGMSLTANKFKGIRAAVCSDTFSARYTRMHNNANILCFGERVVGPGLAIELVDAFLDSEFEGGRHQIRVDMMKKIEDENFK